MVAVWCPMWHGRCSLMTRWGAPGAPDQLEAYLDEACANDPELRRKVHASAERVRERKGAD